MVAQDSPEARVFGLDFSTLTLGQRLDLCEELRMPKSGCSSFRDRVPKHLLLQARSHNSFGEVDAKASFIRGPSEPKSESPVEEKSSHKVQVKIGFWNHLVRMAQ